MEKIIDGFKWEIVPYNKAKESSEQLYLLHNDGSETEISTDEEIEQAEDWGLLIGVERGFVNE